MKYCIRCAREIGEGHTFCPYCGSSQKIMPKESPSNNSQNSSSKTMIVVGVAALVVLAIIITALIEKSSVLRKSADATNSYNVAKEESFTGSPSIQVSASQILSEFKNNEIRAGEKYNGKRVRITGCAASIDNMIGILSIYINSCGGVFDLDYVHAQFPDNAKSRLARLNKGERVVVDCTIVDGGDIMGVSGSNCVLR